MLDYSKYADCHLPVEIKDHIATVTLNRPDRMNAVGGGLREGLEELLQQFNYDEEIRCIVLTGAGDRAFCAGADVKDMASRSKTGDGEIHPLGHILKGAKWLIHHFLNLEAPIIAAINGDAVGLGATLALMCDVTFMADHARIGDTHVKVGLVAGDGGALIWPYLIGMNRAKELLMTGRLIHAEEAGRLGLVNHVVPRAVLMDSTMELATTLANSAPLAVKWTKMACNQHIWQQVVNTHHFALAVESLTDASQDVKEGVRAFAEKRVPNYKGR